MRHFQATLLLLSLAACVPPGGEWEHGPVALSPAPVLLRPTVALNPGTVRADLCLTLPDTLWQALAPSSSSEVADSGEAAVLRFRDGRTVRVEADLRTAAGERWAYESAYLSSRLKGRDDLCFGAVSWRDEPPRFVTVRLTASAPLHIRAIHWQAAAFASL